MVKMKSHLIGGVVSYFIFISVLRSMNIFIPNFNLILYFFLCVFSSIIPDIDMKRSKIHRYLVYIVVLISILIALNSRSEISFYASIFAGVLFLIFLKNLKHRKFFHSIKFGILYSTILGIVFYSFLGDFVIPACAAFTGFFFAFSLGQSYIIRY